MTTHDPKPRRPFSGTEAACEAWRCLDCEDAPCSQACPAGIDVRGFLRKIRFDNALGAGRLIRQANVLGETCSYACPVENLCEGACRNTTISHPVQIARLQEFACRAAAGTGWTPPEEPLPGRARKGRRVAVIGAGPAGLACAAQLARLGHAPVVFEKEEVAGGLPVLQIPEDRVPESSLRADLDYVTGLGVEIRTGAAFGVDLDIDGLFDQGFAAIFFGVGMGASTLTKTAADQGVNVLPAASFLQTCRRGERPVLHGTVAVIGAGNTAMDAAIQAARCGAHDVYLLYRRSFSQMPAWRREMLHAMEAGVHFMMLVQPVEYLSAPEGITIKAVRTELGDPDASGRRRPRPIAGSEFFLTASAVIEAVGQSLDDGFARSVRGVDLDKGRLRVDALSWRTSRPNIFAAGDCVNGGATVAQAVGEGRSAGEAIHAYLTGGHS